MRRGTRAWRVVGIAIATVTIAYGVVVLADLVSHETTVRTATYAAVPVIDIDTDGAVRVVADANATTITVTTRVEHGLRAPSQAAEASDIRLLLTGDCPAVIDQWCHVSYTIVTPPTVTVHARSGSDGINITGIDGDVEASSDAGDVLVRDLGGAAVLRSDAGDIHADEMRSRDVQAFSSAGTVRVTMARTPDSIVARSEADAVLIEVPDDGTAYLITASSDGGATIVDVPTVPAQDQATHSIDASSDADDVTIRLG